MLPMAAVQQFSAPDCFIEKGAWEGGSRPCTAKDFEQWLDDLTHWRAERKIRIGYSEQRYATARVQMDPVRFYPAADDGSGQIFL